MILNFFKHIIWFKNLRFFEKLNCVIIFEQIQINWNFFDDVDNTWIILGTVDDACEAHPLFKNATLEILRTIFPVCMNNLKRIDEMSPN